jgi:hypothetical protein
MATLLANQRTRRSATVAAGGGGGTLIFASDYTNGGGLGRTDAALGDNGLWNVLTGTDPNDGSQIVSAATAGFFGAGNVLQSISNTPEGGFFHPQKTGLGTVAVDGTRNYRWCWRFDQVYAADAEQHGIQDGLGGIGGATWGFFTYYVSATTWRWAWRPDSTANPDGTGVIHYWHPNVTYTTGTWYQLEYQIHRTGTTTFRVHARMYDAAGAVMYDDTTILNNNQSAALSSNPTFNFNAAGAGTTDALHWGCNGMFGDPTNEPFAHMTGLRIVDGLAAGTGWIGGY